jgi:Ricin-type beta-trefoil lectin domain-like
MTGPQRGARHHKSRSPRAWVFGSAGLAGGIAVAAVAVILLTSSGSPEASPTPLATNVTGTQAVGLANPGLVQADGTVAGIGNLLTESPAGPAFASSTTGQTVLPSQHWQADQMGDGAYILVFTPNGRCLATASARSSATAVLLARCDLGRSERWYHPYLGTDKAGRNYWQLRSAADGRCLAVGGSQSGGAIDAAMQRCSRSMPWQQLIAFWSAF